ncbi:MAG: hypothetical protein IKP79_01810, partial [Bacilli bacterium]|nr:hypothetical protein [Bacilli bacterium]
KGANHGNIMVDIDDTEVVQKAYGSLDTNWALYTVDLTNYTGIHTLTIAGGYSDYSGSTSSNTQYYHIELR